MSHFDFIIPLKRDDLLTAQSGRYHVEDIVQERSLLSKIQDAARAYNSDGVEYILEHFDIYFSIVVHGTKLEWNIINKGFDHIIRATKSLCNQLELIFEEQDIETEQRLKFLNVLKMIMYLFISIMKVKDAKLALDNSTKLTLGKKNKKAASNNDISGWTESDKQTALVTLHLILQLPLSRLWDPPLAEENFISLVGEPCYKAVDEQIIKNKSVRETVFQIFGILIKKYNHGTSCLIKLVQILQLSEHAVSPICAGVVQLMKDFGLSTFGPQMVREIAEALSSSGEDAGPSATEASAAKNCGAFLLELTKALPKEMTNAITALQPYLECDESYTLRISILGMMTAVLRDELRGEGLKDEYRVLRDDFLDDLLEHMHDVSAYVRQRVLQYWAQLQRDNCVPVVRQQTVLERTIGRLKDRAALVRKAAIQLLKVFLECNPFSAQLKLEVLKEQLESEQKILEDLQEKVNPPPNSQLVDKFDKIQDDIIQSIKENIDIVTQEEAVLSQESIDNVYESIRRHINAKDYCKAYLIVKHAEREYPGATLLRCDMEKSDQVDYFVALLRSVYTASERLTQESELGLYKRIEEKEGIVAFLLESVSFSQMISEAIPLINTLLMSKQSGDVNEAIEFFTTAYHFNLDSAKIGVANMLMLVWSHDQEKREAVERAYREMYMECDNKTERARAFTISNNLISLMQHVDRGSALALEHLIGKWVQKGDITPAIIQVFWEIFMKKLDGTTDMDSRAALCLLVMISRAKPSVTLANLPLILTHALVGEYHSRAESAKLLLALANKDQRYQPDHEMFESVMNSLLETFNNCSKFYSFAANSIDFIYAVSDLPETIITKLLSAMYKKVEESFVENADNEEEISLPLELLTRFLFVLGQVALQQLVYLDICIYSELRRRNQVREERKESEKQKKITQFATPGKAKGRVDALRRQTHNTSSSSASSRSHRSASVTKGNSANTTIVEEETGLEGAVADDADAEYVRNVCERDIIGENTPLARYLPLLRLILSNPGKYSDAHLQAATALTFVRYMLVSSTVCEDGLQLMVTVLKRSKNVALRTNLTIAFSDLTLRFPNLTQPWTHHIYQILNDNELEVRQCAVKILSFLVLHEMVRVKGQIAEMALCCDDADPSVSEMTKTFFKQLSQKGNALYNVMPDIISRLSDPELNVDENKYRVIMKFITSLIQKDRQMEALVEKLCQRLKLSTDERQWRDLSFCLSLYNYNERSLKKLIENVDSFKDKIHCQGVMDNFNLLMNSASKLAKNDIKLLVKELSAKIEDCFAVKDDDNGEVQEGKEGETQPTKGVRDTSNIPRATPKRKQATQRRPRRRSVSPDENNPPKHDNETPEPARRSSRRAATKTNKNTVDESDGSTDEDDDFQKKKDSEVFKKPATRKVTRKRK